ncbi:methionine adenosyltransferase [Pasteuria penetrans]|uniref:methionine adenosyltransferase n=1 Tax=Pasteuria penetrans TaxID=86005 RepID=UPI000FAE5936|nr:methionine adenosyltransferase [Pasteuria penetrans]
MSVPQHRFFTSESVTAGHPDKMCDQISDAILDSILSQDPDARVACETLVTTGLVLVAGEISTHCYVDIPSVVRSTIAEIGYVRAKYGFDASTCSVLTSIDEQSPDIAQGVDTAWENRCFASLQGFGDSLGAGDQGMMFGFACNDTPEKMPLPISLANRLAQQLHRVRIEEKVPYLRPDGKVQVTVEYDEYGLPVRIDTVVCSAQHAEQVDVRRMEEDLRRFVIQPVLPSSMLDEKTRYFINPSGRFVIGGPKGDAGLTGRKVIVDTYGGFARHGGGAFSGKDPTKVDRSGAYAARYVAKNIVAAGLADCCEVQLAYAIGVSQPVSILVETFGTGQLSGTELAALVAKEFDLSPSGIIGMLRLRRPIYRSLAAYGHFGRMDMDLPWERTDRLASLQRAARILQPV